jgi:hypothetical protein
MDIDGAPDGYTSMYTKMDASKGKSGKVKRERTEEPSLDSDSATPYIFKATAPSYKPVDYTTGSVVDTSHLSRNKPDATMTGGYAARSSLDKNYLDCKATKGGSCKPATTFWQAPGEYVEQATPVCDKHAEQLTTNARKKEINPDHATGLTSPYPQTWPIKPRDVIRETNRTRLEKVRIRTTLEMGLYSQGMRGEDAIFARKNINVGQPGPTAVSHRHAEATLEAAKNLGGHQSKRFADVDMEDSLPVPDLTSKLRNINPETGAYEKEERHPDYLRKVQPPMHLLGGVVPGNNKEKNARGGKVKNSRGEEPPKPLANTFNVWTDDLEKEHFEPVYGHTIDQPIGFGAGDIDYHPEKYPLEVASHKNHVQLPPARGFSKTNRRASEVTIGKPFKPEYAGGGLQKFLVEQEEKNKRAEIDMTQSVLMVPGSSRASAFELAQEEGRGGSERYKALVAKNTQALEDAKKPKEIG